MRHRGGPWQTLVVGPRRRRRLVRELQRGADRPNDVTVAVGVKNRVDHKILNALRSIREQDYPAELIQPVVVDYDSDPPASRELRNLCERFGARCVRVDNQPVWRRAHCLNVAIKQAATRFVMSTDTDVILAPNFIREAIAVLRDDPLTVVYSQMLDLPEETDDVARAMAAEQSADLDALRARATPRSRGDCNEGISITYTHYVRRIRGYDEFFQGWGGEDNDLARRLYYLGLRSVSLKDRSFYLHQWHPKFAGVLSPELEEARHRNYRYFQTSHSIVRNRDGWGEPHDSPRRPSTT